MSDQTFNPFLINENDESLKTKAGGQFGLNASANVAEISFNDKDRDGNESYSVTISVQVGDREYKNFMYFNKGEKVYVKGVLTEPGEEGYDEVYYAELSQKIAVIKHTLKAVGISQDIIANVSATLDPSEIAAGVKTLIDLVPADYKSKPVDLFLEYQWSIKKDNKETFLELPKNMKGGIFLIPAVLPTGKWSEVISEEEGNLTYVDNAGSVHPFTRNKGYMESNRANKQVEGQENRNTGFDSAANPQNAAKTSWGN